jgi:hypothetical protein
VRRGVVRGKDFGAFVFFVGGETLLFVIRPLGVDVQQVELLAIQQARSGPQCQRECRKLQPVRSSGAPFESGVVCQRATLVVSCLPMPNLGGRLPDFIIVGATKAGTTSLDFYLSLHPEIHMARPKEPRFFIEAEEPLGRWGKGVDWYRGLFRTGKKLCGEASPAYTHAPSLSGVPERMARLIPNAKLIYLVREPMERMKSHFLMQCRRNTSSESLADFLTANPESRCLLASCYGSQLERFLQFFPLEQMLVMESEDLARRRSPALRRIFDFLGVDADFSTPLFHHRRNVTAHQRIPNAAGRRILNSRPMGWLNKILPDFLFYHFRNLVLLPFGEPPPSVELPPRTEQRVKSVLRDEVALLRQLTGQKLDSLEIQ